MTDYSEIKCPVIRRSEERAERFRRDQRRRKRELSAEQLKQALRKAADMLVVPIAFSGIMFILLWATSCFEVMP